LPLSSQPAGRPSAQKTGLVTEPNGQTPSVSLPIHGDANSPRTARWAVLSQLEGQTSDQAKHDIGLLVTELVSNSVRYADLGADDTVLVEVALGDDQTAITVTDPGSDSMPHLLPWDLARPDGLGLRLVDRVSISWGVRRSAGATQVWCELSP
jgi:anti-sigma regulatory factor (Ser/Thr protein kinase)